MIERCCNHVGYSILVTCSVLRATCYVLHATLLHATRYVRAICYHLPKICWNDIVAAMLGRCWNGVATIATKLVEQCWNDVGTMHERCSSSIPAASFPSHPSSSIVPTASFQHRFSFVPAHLLQHRSSIVPALLPASFQHPPASFQHYSSIVRASFQPASFHIVLALFEHFSSIVPASVQHCLHLALWPSATRQQHFVVSSVGSGHSISTISNCRNASSTRTLAT